MKNLVKEFEDRNSIIMSMLSKLSELRGLNDETIDLINRSVTADLLEPITGNEKSGSMVFYLCSNGSYKAYKFLRECARFNIDYKTEVYVTFIQNTINADYIRETLYEDEADTDILVLKSRCFKLKS